MPLIGHVGVHLAPGGKSHPFHFGLFTPGCRVLGCTCQRSLAARAHRWLLSIISTLQFTALLVRPSTCPYLTICPTQPDPATNSSIATDKSYRGGDRSAPMNAHKLPTVRFDLYPLEIIDPPTASALIYVMNRYVQPDSLLGCGPGTSCIHPLAICLSPRWDPPLEPLVTQNSLLNHMFGFPTRSIHTCGPLPPHIVCVFGTPRRPIQGLACQKRVHLLIGWPRLPPRDRAWRGILPILDLSGTVRASFQPNMAPGLAPWHAGRLDHLR